MANELSVETRLALLSQQCEQMEKHIENTDADVLKNAADHVDQISALKKEHSDQIGALKKEHSDQIKALQDERTAALKYGVTTLGLGMLGMVAWMWNFFFSKG